jgi:hypothetical protein
MKEQIIGAPRGKEVVAKTAILAPNHRVSKPTLNSWNAMWNGQTSTG